MLFQDYHDVHIFRPECNFGFATVNVIARFDNDISPVLPYLNAAWGAYMFDAAASTLTLKISGKLVTLRAREVAVNGLKDQEEVYNVLNWLKREINSTYDRRQEIEPLYTSRPAINMMAIMKYLPRTNCRECSEPTCLAFAAKVRDGEKGPDDCPPLSPEARNQLHAFLSASGWTSVDADL